MANNKQIGDFGEIEVVKLVPCPNCGKKLQPLPHNYPLYDVQCTACSFRAQIKTNNTKPHNIIFGAGWDIMEKVLKSGFMMPPLIVNFKWVHNGKNKQKIVFFPFVSKKNVTVRRLSPTARRANYRMFNYQLSGLPNMILYEK